jgi:hypothetical protein
MVAFKITRKRLILFSVGMLLLLPVIVVWVSSGAEAIVHGKFSMIHPADDPDAVPVVNAEDLLRGFEDDRDATLKKHGGRIWIRGMVTEVSGPTVTLEGPGGIHCVYVSGIDQTVMRIRTSVGQPVMIEGHLSERAQGRLHLFRPWKKRP